VLAGLFPLQELKVFGVGAHTARPPYFSPERG
jgi:hypothetical protein